ncbi:MAG: NADPH-dependent F420 reductase [Cecembia sp.]
MIGILGGTRLSLTLGKALSSRGVEIAYGVRNGFCPSEIEWKILSMSPDKVRSFKEVIDTSSVLLICAENNFLEEVFEELSKTDLSNKTIIDCTNSEDHKSLTCNTNFIMSKINSSKIFKAFNNLGLDYPTSDPIGLVKETYYCGPDIPEKTVVKQLISMVGFKAIDAGSLENAPLLEAIYHLRNEICNNRKEQLDYHFRLISV